MYEIPQDMAAVEQLAKARQLSVDEVIRLSLQNWIQELLAEGFEGNYYTADLQADALHITAITGESALVDPELNANEYVPRFKTAAHATILLVQTKIRQLITSKQLQ